jgi:hypothetical protein
MVAATDLGGTAMSAPVVAYDAIAVLKKEQLLRVPIIGRQRPAVAKHDGLTFAPVLVEDLNAAPSFAVIVLMVFPPLFLLTPASGSGRRCRSQGLPRSRVTSG